MKRSIRKIANQLIAVIEADNISAYDLRMAARQLNAQAEMLEEGLDP